MSWSSVANANGYVLRVGNPDGNHGSVTLNDTKTTNTIHLDNILASEGLAHQDYFEFQVQATDSSGANLPSGLSDRIRIVDNPILTSGSARRPISGNAWIELQWDKISDASNYTVVYRALGIRLESGGRITEEGRLHKHVDWPTDAQWPNYLTASEDQCGNHPVRRFPHNSPPSFAMLSTHSGQLYPGKC